MSSSIEVPVSSTAPESPVFATVSSHPVARATVTVVPARETRAGQADVYGALAGSAYLT